MNAGVEAASVVFNGFTRAVCGAVVHYDDFPSISRGFKGFRDTVQFAGEVLGFVVDRQYYADIDMFVASVFIVVPATATVSLRFAAVSGVGAGGLAGVHLDTLLVSFYHPMLLGVVLSFWVFYSSLPLLVGCVGVLLVGLRVSGWVFVVF